MTAGRDKVGDTTWNTPRKVTEPLGVVDLDPCSNGKSVVQAGTTYVEIDDGLSKPWFGDVFVNPPYGKGIYDWFKKGTKELDNTKSQIWLVPVAPNTKHWKEFVFPYANKILFLSDSRLKFGDGNNKGAPMACCLIFYGDTDESRFSHLGNFVTLDNNPKI